eukprot:68347-Prorocentrum_minimum.AAC.2
MFSGQHLRIHRTTAPDRKKAAPTWLSVSQLPLNVLAKQVGNRFSTKAMDLPQYPAFVWYICAQDVRSCAAAGATSAPTHRSSAPTSIQREAPGIFGRVSPCATIQGVVPQQDSTVYKYIYYIYSSNTPSKVQLSRV